jgi:chromosome segregation ATPase
VALLSDFHQIAGKLRDEQNTTARLNAELNELQGNLILANTERREGSVLREKIKSRNAILESENDVLKNELASLKLIVDGLTNETARIKQEINALEGRQETKIRQKDDVIHQMGIRREILQRERDNLFKAKEAVGISKFLKANL